MKITDLRGKIKVHKTKKYNTRKLTDIRSIAIHHSLTVSGTPQAFANYHVDTNNWPSIGYTYVVQRDGTVYQTLDHTQVGYHVGDSNKHALGICLVGDFRTQQPTEAQYSSALELVRYLQSVVPSATLVQGHSEYPGYSWKACPVISMKLFRDNLKGENKPMTAQELKMFNDMQKTLKDQQVIINSLQKEVKSLKGKPQSQQNVASWAKEGHSFVTTQRNGRQLSDGVRPEDFVQRQELWTMLDRYNKII